MYRLPITKIEVMRVAVPLAGEGFRNAYSNNTLQHSVVIRIRSNDAIGLGNIDPLPGYSSDTIEHTLTALRQTLAPAVQGMDASNIHLVLNVMDTVSPGFLEAKAAIEMACIDLTARVLGISVHHFLGGAITQKIHFNAWIGIVEPEQAAKEALQWLSKGFKSAKIKLGGGITADRERIHAVRDAVGQKMQLRGDANAGYSVEESIKLGKLLEPYSLQLLEQPVAADDLNGLAKVRQAVSMPIMADEAITDHKSLIAAIRADCADIVKLKVMKQGGLLKCRSMMATASAAGLKIVIGHGFGLGINTMAEIMLASTSIDVLEGLEAVGPLKMRDDIITNKMDLSEGVMDVPDGPGLGLEIDENKLQTYRVDN